MRKGLKLLFFFPILISLFSCSNSSTNTIKRTDIVSCEILGDLYHVQYWDHKDHWDMKNMKLTIRFEDGTSTEISALDKSIDLTFNPESPEGLDHNVTTLELVSGTYTDYKGNKHDITPRTFNGISIVDYPYGDSNSSKGNLFDNLGPIIAIAGSTILFFGIIYIFIKKAKKH